jgi:hypothetical protein
MHGAITVPPVVRMRFLRNEVSRRTTLINTYRPYIDINIQDGEPIPSTLQDLPFHFATTQPDGACEEGHCGRCLGPSSQGDRLHDHRQGRRDIGGTAQRPLYLAAMQQGDEEGMFQPRHRQPLQPRESLPVHGLGRWRQAQRISPNCRLVAKCEQWRSPLGQGDG